MNIDMINLGILAHVDAGKTTVTEGLLYHSGAKKRMGNVDRGTTTTDSMALEQQRGMTIRSSTVSFRWKGKKVNLIDTPGHMDFIAEVERSLSVLDGVILVISAKEGVQPQTRVLFHKLRELKIPTILFLNKLDRLGVDLNAVYEEIRTQLTENLLRMQTVSGEGGGMLELWERTLRDGDFLEEVSGFSDRLLSRFVEGALVSEEELLRELRKGVRRGTLFPLFQGSALNDVGITPLLDALTDCFGHPADSGAVLSAYVYKLERDAAHRKRLYCRVFSGSMAVREKLTVLRSGELFTVRNLLAAETGKYVPTDCIAAGDIGVLLDVPELNCGDFIGAAYHRRNCSSTAEPLLSVVIAPQKEEERKALLYALQELEEEDPFLAFQFEPCSGKLSLRLFGNLQMEIIEALLLERYGLRVLFQRPTTVYKERPAGLGKSTLGFDNSLHCEAGITLSVEPLPPGSGMQYENSVSYGFLEKPFQNAVLEGILQGLEEGLGYAVTDVRVCFLDAEYSSVTSTPSDYRHLAPEVVRLALKDAGTERLEPWVHYRLTAPLGTEKRVFSELFKMRATTDEILYTQQELHITGSVPFDTSHDFPPLLLSFTEGKGMFETKLWRYLPLAAQNVPQRSGDF